MSRGASPALVQALAAFHAPGLLGRLRAAPLPDEMLLLIQAAAGDRAARARACADSGESEAVVVEAATQFIQQVMFDAGSDSYRVLGTDTGSTQAQIKEHHRWLVRWLHPDRQPDAWESAYTDRVNRAWQDLRTDDRRAAFDLRTPSLPPAGPSAPTLAAPPGPAGKLLLPGRMRPRRDMPALPAEVLRRLPGLVLGSLAAGALALLGLQFYLTRAETALAPARPDPRPAASAAARGSGTSAAAAQPGLTSRAEQEAEVRQLVLSVQSAYASGEIGRLRAMFVAAPQPGQLALLEDYERMFAGNSRQRLELLAPRWLARRDTAVVTAGYEAWVLTQGQSEERHTTGVITLELRREAGRLRIARLFQRPAGADLP